MATKVKLRQKSISGNRQSLYLDFYPPIPHPKTGKPTRREFLNLLLFNEFEVQEQEYLDKDGHRQKKLVKVFDKVGKPKRISLTPIEKQHNQETLLLAQQILMKRENQLNKPEIYSGYEKQQLKIKEMGEASFLEYYKKLMDKRKNSTHDNWGASYRYLEAFSPENLKFEDLTEKFCNDYKEYLLTTKSNRSNKSNLATNSAWSYFNKFKATLKQAYKDGYLQTDLNGRIDPIKTVDSPRNFLTEEELNSLIKTDCNDPLLKKAALFSALTGMAFKEIQNLRWGDIEFTKEYGYFIPHKRQKTTAGNVLPVNNQAISLLGERGDHNEQVFKGLEYSAYKNGHLHQWIGAAGITKHITFHCFRHTWATLQLTKGTDLYTVSGMMGHADIKTTQIYAKIIDQTKREAADRIELDM
jgi:integrase